MNAQIEQWRDYLQRHPAIRPDDVDELEAHLRDQIDDLRAAGLTEDEAFLIAVGRIGQVDDVSQEFAREHSERLWKQLVIGPTATTPRTLPVAIGLAVAAAVAVKIPSLFGATAQFYVLNAALLVLPFLAAYFLWQRRASGRTTAAVIGAFAAAAVLVNSYPLVADGDMQILVAIHVPVFLWFVVGLAYVAGHWRDAARRMDFIRFTGEWVVYYTLLALGGGVGALGLDHLVDRGVEVLLRHIAPVLPRIEVGLGIADPRAIVVIVPPVVLGMGDAMRERKREHCDARTNDGHDGPRAPCGRSSRGESILRGCNLESMRHDAPVRLHAPMPPMARYLISRKSSMPYLLPSRPRPDSFMPPKGAVSVEMMPSLMPTMPYSSASATRQTRPMSRE